MILKFLFLSRSSHGDYSMIVSRFDFGHSMVGWIIFAKEMELLSGAICTRQTNHGIWLQTM